LRRPSQPPAHVELLRNRGKLFAECFLAQVESIERPLHPHEEHAREIILVLIGVQNIRAVTIEKLRDGGDNASAVGAIDQKYAGTQEKLAPCL
jgi:hypothetical protein